MITGGLHFLPCACPCDVVHPEDMGICEKTPVVATLQVATGLGVVALLLCVPCASAAREKHLPMVESVQTD